MLENLKHWYKFNFEIIYFYNVYGPKQIGTGNMATVIGIFEEQYKKNKALTVVKPGSQSRRFTHIKDTVETCYFAWKKNKSRHYSISHRQSYSILQVARMFKSKIRYLPKRRGERYASALTSMNLSNKVYKRFGKIRLNNYVKDFISAQKIQINEGLQLRLKRYKSYAGDFCKGVIPDPIPNSEVKPFSADGTLS